MGIWDTAKDVLRHVAPTIGTAVGGPFGGIAATALSNVLLGRPDGTEEEIAEAVVRADPEKLLELRKADQAFQVEMKRIGVDVERIHAEDRASARDRQAKTGDVMPGVIAGAALAGFFGILGAMIFVEIPAAAASPLAVMLGSLGTLVTQIGAFYFGSSKGSSDKNAIMERLLQRNGGAA